MLRLGNPLNQNGVNNKDQTGEEEDDDVVLEDATKNLYEISKRKKVKEESSDDDEDDDDIAELESGKRSYLRRNPTLNEDDLAEFELDDTEKTEHEKDLEDLVFGSIETSILSNIDKLKESKKSTDKKIKKTKTSLSESENLDNKTKRIEIADSFDKRKPAWNDDADQEIVDLNQFDQFSKIINTKSDQVTTSQIEESLKARYTKYYGTPMWADLELKKAKKLKKIKKLAGKAVNDSSDESDLENDAEEEEDDEALFQHTGTFLADKTTSSSSLPKSILDIKVCTNANKEEPHQSRIKSVEFHPTARVMLTAGLDQRLSLFQIDGKKNSKIQTIFIDKFPILSAHFSRNGEEIVMGSRHKNFYYYDMIAGKLITVVPPIKAIDEFHRKAISKTFEISPDNRLIAFVGSQGQIHLFSAKSKEWIDTLKINGDCNAVTFSSDSKYLFAFGDDKDVNIFDMSDRGRRCFHKFTDYGCLSGTSLAVSNNSQFIATGCKSGVVNLYNLNESILNNLNERNPKPSKSFMNLTTPCTSLKFNSTSEILAMCSSFSENSCKLIHVGSQSVFSNFPLNQATQKSTIHTPMRIPESIDFSLNSGYFAIGNHKGNALLFRLKHYGSY